MQPTINITLSPKANRWLKLAHRKRIEDTPLPSPTQTRLNACQLQVCMIYCSGFNAQHTQPAADRGRACNCNGIPVGVRGQRGDRKDQGRHAKDVSRPGLEPESQELASYAITARPPQHDTTRSRHRAFDVFQGSCYTILLPGARHPARASKPSSATSVMGIQLESGAREETGRFRDVKTCVATGYRTWVSGISLLRHKR